MLWIELLTKNRNNVVRICGRIIEQFFNTRI